MATVMTTLHPRQLLNRHLQTSRTHQFPATHLFDSNDKVRTRT